MVKKTLELEILGLACDTEDDVGHVLFLVEGLTKLVRVAIIGSLEGLREDVRFLVDGYLEGVFRVFIFDIVLQCCMTY